MQSGDILISHSDGLTFIHPSQVVQILQECGGDIEQATQRIIDLEKSYGFVAQDNISLVMVKVD